MSGIYAKGQLLKIADYIGPEIQWLLLGGPADADEAQTLHKIRPDIKIIGFEPNPMMYVIQSSRAFPGELVPAALWSSDCSLELKVDGREKPDLQGERSSSVSKYNTSRKQYKVQARTLDGLSVQHGPFKNALLWIDIEGAELECLKGATGLLTNGQIRLASVEVFAEHVQELTEFLGKFGLVEALRWNHHNQVGREWWDILYRLE